MIRLVRMAFALTLELHGLMAGTYRHTQFSKPTLVVLAVAWVMAFWWALSAARPALIAMMVFVGCLLVLFSALTVVVQDGDVKISFGPGVIHRRIPLTRICGVSVVETPW